MKFNDNHLFLENIYAKHHIIMACLADTWERESVISTHQCGLPSVTLLRFLCFCTRLWVKSWSGHYVFASVHRAAFAGNSCSFFKTQFEQHSCFSMIDLDRAGTLCILIGLLGTVWLLLLSHLVWLSTLSLASTELNCLRFRNHAFSILVFKPGTN